METELERIKKTLRYKIEQKRNVIFLYPNPLDKVDKVEWVTVTAVEWLQQSGYRLINIDFIGKSIMFSKQKLER